MITSTIVANGFTGFLGRGAALRELECIMEVAAGRSSKEAAKALGCSPSTIEKAIERAFYKLGVSNRAALVTAAFQRGIIAFACGAPTPGPQHHQDSDDHQGVFVA
jgi:DNA-binding CsgD family transcriptional regulator